ncbi:hypothetical protein GUJ93_ZPchr0001g31482 [Zizania palustris]|uniref:G domain-containing protein n=1 Tax=Zizania palustris TaxID=103762 RepID=A0A8J5VAS2_ZIZPA|nr:hypothetical protein GUJ93_ZPchr0001g31482 [Zizania palustris]
MAASAAVLRVALRRSRPSTAALLLHRPVPSPRSVPPLPPLGRASPLFPCVPIWAGFGYSTLAEESTAPARPKGKARKNPLKQSRFDFTKVDAALLPTVILVGRPNVGKSALFNRSRRAYEVLTVSSPCRDDGARAGGKPATTALVREGSRRRRRSRGTMALRGRWRDGWDDGADNSRRGLTADGGHCSR